ncbi:MAG TPA: glycosyltransferase, partial [Phycisphaerae bacterium]|nr:glycosyltransferase [Phycisphaerae bacterium]
MTIFLLILIACEVQVLLLWVWGMAWVRKLQDDDTMQIVPGTGQINGAPPSLAVLIAAHNEQNKIEACLRSLLSQDYPNMQVIVADDRSEDGTSIRVRG